MCARRQRSTNSKQRTRKEREREACVCASGVYAGGDTLTMRWLARACSKIRSKQNVQVRAYQLLSQYTVGNNYSCLLRHNRAAIIVHFTLSMFIFMAKAIN